MALQSQLFRNDPKLEAAAVSDPAHIFQGASGEHVRKIQLALNQLDSAGIDPDGEYGPATAAAVLAYKRKRSIINRSRQAQADNIVGIMTMAALDSEMLAFELRPILLVSLFPGPRSPSVPGRRGSSFAINRAVTGPSNVPNLVPQVFPQFQQDVTISQGGIGTLQALLAAGGKLMRTQSSRNDFQVAKLLGAKKQDRISEELDIRQDSSTHSYEALNCGETFFMVVAPPQKISQVVRLLSLVQKATPMTPTNEDRSPDTKNFPSGLVSKAGTPLNPLPGRRINLFGEGETPGFEEYSSDIDFCSHTFSNGNGPPGEPTGHRPWTADPRNPPGIADKSVSNICGRSFPVKPETIAEILRIGAGKCRVTYAEAAGRQNCDRLRAGLKSATVIEEGIHDGNGRAIVLELA